MHIFCEGEKTEPNYFHGYINKCFPGNRRLKIIKIEKTKKNTPIQLVEEAVKMKKSRTTPKGDVFWVVYDRESTAKYTEQNHQSALQKARTNNVKVALSNVCFEIWILLHFVDGPPCYSSFDDLLSNSALKTKLAEQGIKDYSKSDRELFKKLEDKIPQARERAARLNAQSLESAAKNTEPFALNPYTDVYLVLDEIDKFGSKSPEK
nr:RloB family protein [Aliikangiella sp. G2MR2-5]